MQPVGAEPLAAQRTVAQRTGAHRIGEQRGVLRRVGEPGCRRVARALRAEAMARPRKLVETLAEDMGKVCLKEFGARHVIVTLRKFILPRTDSVSVTVHVSRHR